MTDFSKLKDLLESEMDWPNEYLFKFIVPSEQVQLLKSLLPEGQWSQRPSSSGRYLSVTIKATFESSDGVIEVYERVRHIQGIMSL